MDPIHAAMAHAVARKMHSYRLLVRMSSGVSITVDGYPSSTDEGYILRLTYPGTDSLDRGAVFINPANVDFVCLVGA